MKLRRCRWGLPLAAGPAVGPNSSKTAQTRVEQEA
jgi:hypothetical protein